MKSPSSDILRIIDASLNRIGEGLRVLEEYARFSLDNTTLTQRLKNLRHGLVLIDTELQKQLLRCRDASGDVGADMEVPGESKMRDITGMITANARRVQESLRVMEEIAKDRSLNLETNNFKQARFELYTLEKDLLGQMLRQDKLKCLTGLYVIIDTAFLKGRSLNEVATQVIRGGAKVIQLRYKERSTKAFFDYATVLKKICTEKNILFIINDSLEVALACGADGLHVGQDDLPVAVARRLLPIDKILGCSTHDLEEAKTAASEGADYLGVGTIYPTTTKETSGTTGTEIIREFKKLISLPLVAIGGINKSNVRDVIRAGADATAVISAVMGADDIEKATRQLIETIKGTYDG